MKLFKDPMNPTREEFALVYTALSREEQQEFEAHLHWYQLLPMEKRRLAWAILYMLQS